MNQIILYDRIYQVVKSVPSGQVATYGQIAFLAGLPRGARLAGRAMAAAPTGIPCHRVVNSRGICAPCFPDQRALLEAEGVAFTPTGRVDMKRFLWHASLS